MYVHFWCFGFVLPVEELWEGSAFNRVNAGGKQSTGMKHICSAAGFFCDSVLSPVVIEPGSVARYNDVMGLLGHVVLVEVGAFYRLTLQTRGTFLLLLVPETKHL